MNRSKGLWLGVGLVAVAALGRTVWAQDTYTDPEKAGEDFKIQGEYMGKAADGGGLGADVIARGDGKFEAFFMGGGLPGDGWDGKTRVQTSGEIAPLAGPVSVTILSGNGYQASIRNQVMEGKTPNGQAFTLNRIVRQSPTLGAKPLHGAIVLFDGTNTDEWQNARLEEGKYLNWGVTSKRKFQDFVMHLEFRLPFMPKAGGQGRGNSGVYLQGRYEIQVLDSFGLTGEDNECGGIYHQAKPLVNMCYPPLLWQTYDIDFTAARYDAAGKKTANARLTLMHNGVTIHKDLELTTNTPGNIVPENPEPGPFYLQDHGNPVVYRNIWVLDKAANPGTRG